jgi:DNA-binding response OmpR family regulator
MTSDDYKMKVLIADPQEEMRQLIVVRLQLMGLEVVETGSAAELPSLINSHSPDLVISEWSLGALEGEKLLEVLQPYKRMVILFSDREEEDAPFFLSKTGVKALVKRKHRSELMEKVKALMSGEKRVASEPRSAEGKHILLIEDSPVVRHFVKQALSKAFSGCVIREAEDGRNAISEMAQKKVDLILTDLEMPGMDGFTFLRRIRSNPLLKRKPIMVLSSAITSELMAEFADDPNIRFLMKPSNPQEIAQNAKSLMPD